MKKTLRESRQSKGEKIARRKLKELGFTIDKAQKRCEDMIAVKGDCRIPIQVKPIPLTRTNDQTNVDDSSLVCFRGLYLIWVEQKDGTRIFMYIPDQIFRDIMHKKGKMYATSGQIRPHKNRWFLHISRSIRGFEQYADDTIPDRFCEDEERLLEELSAGRPTV